MKMLRNYPLDPIGQNLLLSECGRLKAWMLKAFSNQNDPVILWVFLLHHIQAHCVHPAHWPTAGHQCPGFIQRCLFISLSSNMCPNSEKTPSGTSFGGIGTNPWAGKSYELPFFLFVCFLKWRIFYCGIWLLAYHGAVRKKKLQYS